MYGWAVGCITGLWGVWLAWLGYVTHIFLSTLVCVMAGLAEYYISILSVAGLQFAWECPADSGNVYWLITPDRDI